MLYSGHVPLGIGRYLCRAFVMSRMQDSGFLVDDIPLLIVPCQKSVDSLRPRPGYLYSPPLSNPLTSSSLFLPVSMKG
jgi:hypothetical protein